MNSVHVEAFDLNLLLAFDALWTERHVTRAARRVGLTQSAMSHALGRLRAQLDDPLFQPTPRGLTATARAHALAPLVAEALSLVRRAGFSVTALFTFDYDLDAPVDAATHRLDWVMVLCPGGASATR